MEKLRKLNLSIPALDSIECKSLMGGDGYYQGSTPENAIPIDPVDVFYDEPEPDYDYHGSTPENAIPLPPAEVVYDDGEPDHDYPTDDDDDDGYEDDKSYLEDERTGDHDNDNDLENNSDQPQDEKQASDYTVPTELQDAFSKLPEKVQEILKELKIPIVYNPNYSNPENTSMSSYDPKLGQIITAETNEYKLLREAIHAIQDSIGAMDLTSRSAEEFQEKALGDLVNYYNVMIEKSNSLDLTLAAYCDGDGAKEWSDFLKICVDDNMYFDREYFKEHIMEYFDIFQDSYKNVSGYNDPLEDDYNWSWDYFFEILGL